MISRLRTLLGARDALVLTSPENTFYACRYASTFCVVIVTHASAYFLTDARYLDEAEENLSDAFQIILTKGADVYKTVLAVLTQDGCQKVGLDEGISYGEYIEYANVLKGLSLDLVAQELKALRAEKTEEELSLIVEAQKITDRSFLEIIPYLKEGVSEREIRVTLDYILQKHGADACAFDTIVAFGENTAKPHAHSGSRTLRCGDAVLMDFGAKYRGYCSDMTRTVAFGHADDAFKKAYADVLEANRLGIERIAAGISAAVPHEAVCDYFEKLGMREYFTHSLGHGVGIEIHEDPVLGRDMPLKKGMIVTVEPGLYFKNRFGIRIEDMVSISEDGCLILTASDKKLSII